MNIRKISPVLIAASAAAAAGVLTAGSASAAPATARPVVHYARCEETSLPEAPVICLMSFAAGKRPGDVHIVIRTSQRQRVVGTWWVDCGEKAYAGGIRGMTTVRRHVLGQARSAARCTIAAQVNGTAAGSVAVVVRWVNR